MIIVGIDPGLTGALGMVGHDGQYLGCVDIPTMQRGEGASVKNQVNVGALAAQLKEWLRDYDKNEVAVVVERVQPMPAVRHTPGQGKGFQIIQGSASTFSLGHTAGCVEATVTVLGYPLHLVQPGKWKKVLGLTSSKEQCRAAAIRLFPDAPLSRMKDHNRAESLLLARYGHQEIA